APSVCTAFSAALTRYRLEDVAAPWIVAGVRRTISLPTIVAEHYHHAALADSRNMGRSVFSTGVGRVNVEAWTTGKPARDRLAHRCPGTAWSTPPAAGWVLSDCRYATNLAPEDGGMSADRFGWPGPLPAPAP